jgi:DNA-binding NarL/FixJ family response regulator
MNESNGLINRLTVAPKSNSLSSASQYSQHDLYSYALKIVDAIQGIVVILDRLGHVLYRNQSCKELFPGLESLSENTTLWDAVDWTDGADRLKQLFDTSDSALPAHQVELQYHDPQKGNRRMSWTVRPLSSHLGMAALYVLTGHDRDSMLEAAIDTANTGSPSSSSDVRSLSQINATVLSLLQAIGDRLAPNDRHLVDLLQNALESLADPITDCLDQHKYNLTPREIDVASMIRRGFSSKQIASVLHLSIHTVHNQRRSIRKKLKIDNDNTNLESYLKSL